MLVAYPGVSTAISTIIRPYKIGMPQKFRHSQTVKSENLNRKHKNVSEKLLRSPEKNGQKPRLKLALQEQPRGRRDAGRPRKRRNVKKHLEN
jgi:hypothetical protein